MPTNPLLHIKRHDEHIQHPMHNYHPEHQPIHHSQLPPVAFNPHHP
jgi:hypothetical protein